MYYMIVLEGPDGSGKSTLAKALQERLADEYQGRAEVMRGSEPNNLIRSIRDAVLQPFWTDIDPVTGETFISEKALPAQLNIGLTAASVAATTRLACKKSKVLGLPVILISDRSVISAFAYQALADNTMPPAQQFTLCTTITSVYRSLMIGPKIGHIFWLRGQFSSEDRDAYSEQGKSDSLRKAYETLRRLSTTDDRVPNYPECWRRLLNDVADGYRTIENGDKTVEESVNIVARALAEPLRAFLNRA